MIDIIQIWTYDQGNMEFYGYKTTIYTEVKLRSILLPKIYKTLIALIIVKYLLYYMSDIYGSSPVVYRYYIC